LRSSFAFLRSSCLAAKRAEQRGKEPNWNGQPKRDWTGRDLPGALPGASGTARALGA